MKIKYEIEIRIMDLKSGSGVRGVAFMCDKYIVDAIGMRRRLLSNLPQFAISAQRRALDDAMREMIHKVVEADPTVVVEDCCCGGCIIAGASITDPAIDAFVSDVNALKNISARVVKSQKG